MATVLLARQLLTPLERIDDAALVMEDGIIAAVGTREDLSLFLRVLEPSILAIRSWLRD